MSAIEVRADVGIWSARVDKEAEASLTKFGLAMSPAGPALGFFVRSARPATALLVLRFLTL